MQELKAMRSVAHGAARLYKPFSAEVEEKFSYAPCLVALTLGS